MSDTKPYYRYVLEIRSYPERAEMCAWWVEPPGGFLFYHRVGGPAQTTHYFRLNETINQWGLYDVLYSSDVECRKGAKRDLKTLERQLKRYRGGE